MRRHKTVELSTKRYVGDSFPRSDAAVFNINLQETFEWGSGNVKLLYAEKCLCGGEVTSWKPAALQVGCVIKRLLGK